MEKTSIEDTLEPQSLPPMPPLRRTTSASGKRLMRQQSATSHTSNETSWNENTKHSAKQRRIPKATPSYESLMSAGTFPMEEDGSFEREQEQELIKQLAGVLGECSRQRLRSIQMSMRGNGTGEARITAKELYQVLVENHIKVTSRVYQLFLNLYEDSFGINYEKMWTSLVLGHRHSGRDSVLAQNKKNIDEINNSGKFISKDERDEDLVLRVGEQLARYREPYDIDEVKCFFQAKDKDKAGKISRDEAEEAIVSCELPLYGALLTALLARCDDESNGQVSWPETMGFLERAKASLIGKGQMTKEDFVKLQAQRKELLQENAKKSTELSSKESQAQVERLSKENPATLQEESTKKSPSSDAIPDPLAKEIVRSAFKKAVFDIDGGNVSDLDSDTTKLKSSLKEKGFLSSMRSLLKGKKRTDSPTPLLPNSEGPTPTSTPRPSRPPSKTTANTTNQGLNASTTTTLTRPTSSTTLSTPVASGSPLPSPRAPNERPRSGSKQNGKTPVHNEILAAPGRLNIELNGKKIEFAVPENFNASNASTDPPQERLQLDWVYGYRGHDTRTNIHILKTNELLYFIGTVIILYNREEHKQRHYREHTHEIRSVAVHPNKMTIATGQSASNNAAEDIHAHVRVWRGDTLQTLHILGINIFYKSVVCLAFSASEDRLCAIDDSPEHYISAWDVSVGKFLAKSPLGIDYICDIDFQPRDPTIVTVIGREHLGWWKIQTEQSTIELLRKAEYQTYLKPRFVTCLWHNEKDDLITGDSNGTMYVWGHGGNIITNLMKHAHYGPILSIAVTRGHIITGGRDCLVEAWVWNKNMDRAGKLEVPATEGGVRMLVVHKDKLLIGTTNNSIMMATLSGTALRNPFAGISLSNVLLTQGHVGDIRGLSILPDAEGPHVMLTAGLDGNICAYDTDKRLSLWKCPFKIENKKTLRISCLDCNFTGSSLAFATIDNSAHMFNIGKDDDGALVVEEVFNVTLGKPTSMSTPCAIKLAPDCSRCAIGHTNGSVSMLGLTLSDDEQLVWDVLIANSCHIDRITGLDWTVDKRDETYMIRTSSESLSYAVWKASTLERVQNLEDAIKMKWASVNCKLLYGTIGVWFSKQALESRVSAIDINPQQSLVAMGDTHGYLSLFRYPCCKKGECEYVKQHVNVIGVAFMDTDSPFISIGSGPEDTALLQWIIT